MEQTLSLIIRLRSRKRSLEKIADLISTTMGHGKIKGFFRGSSDSKALQAAKRDLDRDVNLLMVDFHISRTHQMLSHPIHFTDACTVCQFEDSPRITSKIINLSKKRWSLLKGFSWNTSSPTSIGSWYVVRTIPSRYSVSDCCLKAKEKSRGYES